MADRLEPEEREKIRARLNRPPRYEGMDAPQKYVLKEAIDDGLALLAELDALREDHLVVLEHFRNVAEKGGGLAVAVQQLLSQLESRPK